MKPFNTPFRVRSSKDESPVGDNASIGTFSSAAEKHQPSTTVENFSKELETLAKVANTFGQYQSP
jgi:hypothetical protein